MSERELPATVVYVGYVCDDCGRGWMEPTGNTMLMSDPPQFPHACTSCGATRNFTVRYPMTKIQPDTGEK